MLLRQGRAASQALAAAPPLAGAEPCDACKVVAVVLGGVVEVVPRPHAFAVAVSRSAADGAAMPSSVGRVMAALVCGVSTSAPPNATTVTALAAMPAAVTQRRQKPSVGSLRVGQPCVVVKQAGELNARDVAATAALVLVRLGRMAISLQLVAKRWAVGLNGVPVLVRPPACGVLAEQDVAPSCALTAVDAAPVVDAYGALRRAGSVAVVVMARRG